MILVDAATLRPAMCLMTKSASGPFIDFLRDFDFDHDGRMYLRVEYARELGRFVGLVDPPGEEETDRVAELEARIVELEDELAQADGVIDAIDVIESRDFRARRKTGRPRKTTMQDEEVAA